jgi:polysaccharide export outer membrane protein
MKTPRTILLLAASTLLFGAPAIALASGSDQPAAAKSPSDIVVVKGTSLDAGASYQTDNYKLRPTDVINVNVVDDPNATHDYRINVDGTVQLVYLDAVSPLKLAGLTIADAKKAITKAYVDNKIFIRPSITIDVKEFSTRRINVNGQVGKPGPIYIPAEKDMTLVEAITEAGGPTDKAAATVNITRILPDGKTTTLQDVDLYGAMKDAKKDVPLQEGDTIFLGESAFANVWQH